MPTITVNGQQVTVDDSFLSLSRDQQDATVDEIAKSLPAAKKAEPSGVIAGIRQGISNFAGGHAATDKAYLGADDTALNNVAQKTAVKDYVPANVFQGTIDPRKWQLGQAPQAIAEAAPGLISDLGAASVAARVTPGGAIPKGLAAIAAGATSAWHRNAGNTANEVAKAAGRDTPNAADLTRAGVTEGVSGAVGSLPLVRLLPGANTVTNVGTKGAAEALLKYGKTVLAGTGGAGAADAAHQVGTTIGTDEGVKYDPERGINSALTGGMMTGIAAAPRAAADVNFARSYREFGGANKDAAQGLAKRLSDTDQNIKSSDGAFDAMSRVRKDLGGELNDAANNVRKQTTLSQDAENALEAVRANKPVTAKDVELIAKETAGTPDGDNVTHLARQAYLSQRLLEKGSYDARSGKWAGGISGLMDKNLPWITNPSKALVGTSAAALGFHMLGTMSPMWAGSAYGTYGAARVADSLTGARSPANQFVQHFNNLNAQTRLPAAMPQTPPQAPTTGPAQPWGPVPPASGPTGPRVAPPPPPGPPPPAPGTMGPWGPKPLPTTSGVPNVPPPAPPAPKAPWAAPKVGEAPLDLPPAFTAMLKAARAQPDALPDAFSAMLGKRMPQAPSPAPEPAPAPVAPPPAPPPAPAPQGTVPWKAPGVTELPQFNPTALRMLQAQIKANGKAFAAENKAATAAKPAENTATAPQPNAPTSIADILSNVNSAIEAPAPKKITKKDGKVEVSQPALAQATTDARFEGRNPYRVLEGADVKHAGKTHDQIAKDEVNSYFAERPDAPQTVKDRYRNRVLDALSEKQRIADEMTAEHPASAQIVKALMDQLNARGGDKETGIDAIAHHAGLLSPEAGTALKSKFTENSLRRIYEKSAERKARERSEKKAQQEKANGGTATKGRKSSKKARSAKVQEVSA